jgi:3-dehydroquinate synthase
MDKAAQDGSVSAPVRTDEFWASISVSWQLKLVFSDQILRRGNPALSRVFAPGSAKVRPKVMVFVDRGLHEANAQVIPGIVGYLQDWRDCATPVGDPQLVPGGEQAKRDSTVVDRCVQLLHDAHLDRHSYVMAIGGGAVLDAVCFAASMVHRGLRQIRIPTTVLAQNDAGIGVKNGINYRGTKNFLGSFHPPDAVVNDFTLLRTLAPQQWRDGTSEAVKVGLIRDAAFFEWIESHAADLAIAEEHSMRHLIRRCARLHLLQIATSGDPFERGSARPLDFGHWAAHRLEQMSNSAISHGHAVAIGIAIDSLYAGRAGMLSDDDTRRILGCVRQLGFDFDGPAAAGIRRDDLDALIQGIADFQEHLGGRLCLTFPGSIGVGTELNAVDLPMMKKCCESVLFDQLEL